MQATALTSALLYRVSTEKLMERLPSAAAARLVANGAETSLDKIVSKVLNSLSDLNVKSKAMFEGSCISDRDMQIKLREPAGLLREHQKLKRLEPWLKQARAKRTNDAGLVNRLKKVKLIDQKNTSYRFHVGSDEEKEVKEMMKNPYFYAFESQASLSPRKRNMYLDQVDPTEGQFVKDV